jgi:hypothetical protein
VFEIGSSPSNARKDEIARYALQSSFTLWESELI